MSRTAVAGLIAAAATVVFSQGALADTSGSSTLSRQDVCIGADGALRFGSDVPSDCERVKDAKGHLLSVGRTFRESWATEATDLTLLDSNGAVVRDGLGLEVSLRGDLKTDQDGKETLSRWWIGRGTSSTYVREHSESPRYGHAHTQIKDGTGQDVTLQGLDLDQLKTLKPSAWDAQWLGIDE